MLSGIAGYCYGYIAGGACFRKFGKMANEALKKCIFCIITEQKCGSEVAHGAECATHIRKGFQIFPL
ncbi:hypothetical protein EGK65_23435 [Citrobacter farmeri]|nr:hypothetical protein EGK65_23435 [Citrobacter farmeri]